MRISHTQTHTIFQSLPQLPSNSPRTLHNVLLTNLCPFFGLYVFIFIVLFLCVWNHNTEWFRNSDFLRFNRASHLFNVILNGQGLLWLSVWLGVNLLSLFLFEICFLFSSSFLHCLTFNDPVLCVCSLHILLLFLWLLMHHL